MSDDCCGAGEPCLQVEEAAPAPLARQAFFGGGSHLPLAISGALLATAVLSDWAGRPGLTAAAAVGAIALVIRTPMTRGWQALVGRRLDINLLMVLAVVGAALLGEWAEAAAVVWLFAVAHLLESRSMERARHAVRALSTLAPAMATVRTAAGEAEVAVGSLAAGDVVLVRPGGRVPVDGRVVAGSSAVDQAPVTGESIPVEKAPGDEVFAATVNGAGALDVLVTRPASESTISRIARLVDRAQRERAPIQTLVDRFAARYTPAVVLLALAVAIVPPLAQGWSAGLGLSASFAAHGQVWVYRALALLVVACPCALVISTPVSIVSALTRAARSGVLIKGGAHLERLAAIRCVAFDKTGTLTLGQVAVTDVRAVDGQAAGGLLAVAASLESRSEHPIGRAIVSHARLAGLAFGPADGFRALPGFGAEATVGAELAVVGSHRLFEERRLCTPALHDRLDEIERAGASAVFVGHGDRALGIIGVADVARAEGRPVVSALRSAGVTRIALLTGDAERTALAMRDAVGLDEVHAGLLPVDKVAHIHRLRARWGPVAMVGDGINDAPALATADVGIAMGAAGTDVALETADVALMADDLEKLPFAIDLGRRTVANVRQNIGIALGLKLAFVGLAVAGLATMWMAVLADTGASLLVTANGLRLLRGSR